MAEANEAEPNERAAPSPRRPRRKHVINLCCAQSVHRVVEEVARNLEGLGFHTNVVTGAEARAALLGSRTDSEQPTIHVVCVQGSMQERVLKPLRQALATHGGPNHHLFVAVLDLGVPLAMVGQIRRFAEALERPASGSQAAAIAAGHELSSGPREPSRSYPSVAQVVERGGTKPPFTAEGDEGERQPRRTRPRMAKVPPTSKYQAVTARSALTPTEPGVRKRRRERSRLRPSAMRQPTDERVLGLPEQQSRPPSAGRREQQPPPPPAPGELARRRSSTSLPEVSATPPPPPPVRAPAAAPDQAMQRRDPGFRFTPPGVKGADARPQSGPFPAAPVGELLSDPDKTMVQSGIAEVPRTASTLRLDEPPFADGAKPRGRDQPERTIEEEPVEPTMIIAAPARPGAAPVERAPVSPASLVGAKPVAPAASGETVVGPPPKPAPAVLAELERVRREAGASASAGPRKTVGYLQREDRAETPVSESSRTLVHHPSEDDDATGPESSRTLVLRPREGDHMLDSESSGTLVLKPRTAVMVDEEELLPASSSTLVQRPRIGDARPSSESSGTMRPRLGGAAPSSESSGTMRPRLGGAAPSSESSGTMRPRLGGAAPSSESSGTMRPRLGGAAPSGPSGTVVQPAPPAAGAAEVSESERTLLRSDGSFENSRELMQKIEVSRRGPGPSPSEASSPTTSQSDPRQVDFKAGKTALYSDSAAVPLPTPPTADQATPPTADQGGTVVAKPSTAPSAAAAGAAASERAAAAVSSESSGTVVSPKPAGAASTSAAASEAAPGAEERDPAAPLPTRTPPSAIPTERHPAATVEPESKAARGPRAKKRVGPSERPLEALSARSGVLTSDDAPRPREQARPRTAAPRARAKPRGSQYGWLWIMLALLTAGGGWGAYQAGLFDDLLGRRRAGGSTVADAGTPPTPADEAGAEAGAAADAGAAEAGAADAGAIAPADAAEAGAASTSGPTEADSAPAASAGANDSTDTGASPDPTTGGPEPAAASTGGPDEPAETRGPEPADGGPPDQPPTSGGEPEPVPGTGPQLSAEEQKLSPAVEQRRVFMLKKLYATRRQGEETTFLGAWARCAKLEVDGVKGWRLPHRREMKLVNAVLTLSSGVYWTRTVPPEDKSSAYVLDTADASLSLFLKEEPNGDVICVRERKFPEK